MRARGTRFAAGLMLAAGVLAGCAGAPPEIAERTAADMQTAVVSVAESAGAGDTASALAALDGLQEQLDAALADGSVTPERAAAIQARIDLVRAALTPEPEPAVEPEPAPAPEVPTPEVPIDTGDSGSGNDKDEDDKDEEKEKGKSEENKGNRDNDD